MSNLVLIETKRITVYICLRLVIFMFSKRINYSKCQKLNMYVPSCAVGFYEKLFIIYRHNFLMCPDLRRMVDLHSKMSFRTQYSKRRAQNSLYYLQQAKESYHNLLVLFQEWSSATGRAYMYRTFKAVWGLIARPVLVLLYTFCLYINGTARYSKEVVL
jgi:hypothetical protein